MHRLLMFAGIGVLLLGSSCSQKVLFETAIEIPASGWRSDNFIQFEIPVSDTLESYSIDLNLKHDGRYAYSNLFLFVNTFAPTGATIRDTVECKLADKAGKWAGRGISGRYRLSIPYKYQVVFPTSGTYRIEIEQGMREDPLPFISDVGISIQRD